MRVAAAAVVFVCGLTRGLPAQAWWTEAPRPAAPVVVEGACPFECCQYGTWHLRRRAKPRPEPRRDAPTAGTIAVRSRLHADTGFVRVARLGLVEVTTSSGDSSQFGIPLVRGDTIILLDYQGEGAFNGWYRGRLASTMIPFDRTGAGGYRLIQEPETEWWAHVRWVDHGRPRQGWLRMADVSADGVDGCG